MLKPIQDEQFENLVLLLSSANRGAWSNTRSSAALSGSETEDSGHEGESGELHCFFCGCVVVCDRISDRVSCVWE